MMDKQEEFRKELRQMIDELEKKYKMTLHAEFKGLLVDESTQEKSGWFMLVGRGTLYFDSINEYED